MLTQIFVRCSSTGKTDILRVPRELCAEEILKKFATLSPNATLTCNGQLINCKSSQTTLKEFDTIVLTGPQLFGGSVAPEQKDTKSKGDTSRKQTGQEDISIIGGLLSEDASDTKRGAFDSSRNQSVMTNAEDELTDADGAVAAIRQQLIVRLRMSAKQSANATLESSLAEFFDKRSLNNEQRELFTLVWHKTLKEEEEKGED